MATIVKHPTYPLGIKKPMLGEILYFYAKNPNGPYQVLRTCPTWAVNTLKAVLRVNGSLIAYDVSHGFDGNVLTVRFEDKEWLERIKFTPHTTKLLNDLTDTFVDTDPT